MKGEGSEPPRCRKGGDQLTKRRVQFRSGRLITKNHGGCQKPPLKGRRQSPIVDGERDTHTDRSVKIRSLHFRSA